MSYDNNFYDKKASIQKQYYQERNMKKLFNLDDSYLALNRYASNNDLDIKGLNEEQKQIAITQYKDENKSIFEGVNNYSEFLHVNFGDELTETDGTLNNVEEASKGFWGNAWREIKQIVGLDKETRDQIARDFHATTMKVYEENDGELGFAEYLGLFSALKSSIDNSRVPTKVGEDIVNSIQRGAMQVVDAGGSALVELYEKKNFRASQRVDMIENDGEFKELFDEYNELNEIRTASYSGGRAMTEEEQSRFKELASTKVTDNDDFSDNTLSSVVELYEKDKRFLNKKSNQALVLGKSLKSLSAIVVESEGLNNEYTKGIRTGEVEMTFKDSRFWTNQMPEVVGQVGAIVGLTFLTPGVPDEYAALGYVVDSIPINLMYSASEANQVREEARAMGYSESEIDKMTSKTFKQNVAVQGALGAAPGAVTKLAGKSKAFNAFINTSYAKRITGKLATVGVDAMFEGFEEILQDEIRTAQLSDDYKFLAEANAETFILGFGGGLFGGGSVIIQEAAFQKQYTELSEDDSIGPIMKNIEATHIEEGKTALEAKDLAMQEVTETLSGTAKGKALNDNENKIIQQVVAQKVIKGAKDAKAQESQIKLNAMQKSDLEKRNSEITGTQFSYKESNPNIRIIKGPDTSAKYSDDIGISNMLMQESYKQYDIEYDSKTNVYSKESKNAFTKFSKDVNTKKESYMKVNELIKGMDSKVKVENTKAYMKSKGISNNNINSMYEYGILTDSEYVSAVRKLGIKPRETQLANNIKTADKINKHVNNIDKLSEADYNAIKKSLIDDFGTFEKGMSTLEKLGAITPADSTIFKNHQKTLDKQKVDAEKKAEADAKDTTKKDLDTATKTVEKQKDQVSKLKEDNKKLKTQVKEESVPQKVVTVKELQQDKKVGKTKIESTLDSLRDKRVHEDKMEKSLEHNLAQIMGSSVNQNVARMVEEERLRKIAAKQEPKQEPKKVKPKKTKIISKQNPVALAFAKYDMNPKTSMVTKLTKNEEMTHGPLGDGYYVYAKNSDTMKKSMKLLEREFVDVADSNTLNIETEKQYVSLVKTMNSMHKLFGSAIDNTVAYGFTSYDMTRTFKNYKTIKSIYDVLIDKDATEDRSYDRYNEINYDSEFDKKELTYINVLKRELDIDPEFDINFVEAGIFDFVENMEEILTQGKELGFTDVEIHKSLVQGDNFIESKYDGILSDNKLDDSKYPSMLFNFNDLNTLDGKEFIKTIRGIENLQNKTDSAKREIC